MHGRVLIIAGSDSGGGAGIQADIKAVMAMGGFAATAVTAITAQNTLGVYAIHAVPSAMVAAQIEAVLNDIGADAIKIGMLGNPAIISTVARCLRDCTVPIVVDPVMIAKGGQALLAADATHALRDELLPLAALVTPNLPEAAALLGDAVDDTQAAAMALSVSGLRAVLVKGGHAVGSALTDVLVNVDGVRHFTMDRILTRHTHGTGCTLASAITAGLAQNMELTAAITRARAYVQEAIRSAPGFGAGHGPLNHNAKVTEP